MEALSTVPGPTMSSFKASLILNRACTLHTLTTVTPGREPAACGFDAVKVIHNGRSIVQRGTLHIDGKPDVEAVCKIVQGDLSRLQREAELYVDPQHLLRVQGRFVPFFYGYFECTVEHYGRKVQMGCMILEYCGRAISHKELCKDAFKLRIVHALIHLHHEAHLVHGDFEVDAGWRHLLVKDDESVRLIDFDESGEHCCEQAIPVDLWQYEPTVREFGCMELWDIFMRLSVWTPSFVCVSGRYYHVFEVPTPERLLKLIKYRRPKTVNERLERQVHQAYHDYYTLWHKRFKVIGYPIQHKEPLNLPGVDESDDEQPIPPPPKHVWRKPLMFQDEAPWDSA